MHNILQHDALRKITIEFDPPTRTAALVAWTWWTGSKDPVAVVLYAITMEYWNQAEAQRLLAAKVHELASEMEGA
jgi:hypothetical protein